MNKKKYERLTWNSQRVSDRFIDHLRYRIRIINANYVDLLLKKIENHRWTRSKCFGRWEYFVWHSVLLTNQVFQMTIWWDAIIWMTKMKFSNSIMFDWKKNLLKHSWCWLFSKSASISAQLFKLAVGSQVYFGWASPSHLILYHIWNLKNNNNNK